MKTIESDTTKRCALPDEGEFSLTEKNSHPIIFIKFLKSNEAIKADLDFEIEKFGIADGKLKSLPGDIETQLVFDLETILECAEAFRHVCLWSAYCMYFQAGIIDRKAVAEATSKLVRNKPRFPFQDKCSPSIASLAVRILRQYRLLEIEQDANG